MPPCPVASSGNPEHMRIQHFCIKTPFYVLLLRHFTQRPVYNGFYCVWSKNIFVPFIEKCQWAAGQLSNFMRPDLFGGSKIGNDIFAIYLALPILGEKCLGWPRMTRYAATLLYFLFLTWRSVVPLCVITVNYRSHPMPVFHPSLQQTGLSRKQHS